MRKSKGVREAIGATRKVEGKTYRQHNSYLRRQDAIREGEKLQSKGWSVRLNQVLGLWVIWKRRP